uniref:Uncharacterized protein n=1 Tax=Oryza glumipatula TaxID=40148 RepID=A0A0E0ATC6_9ORYZ
MKKQTNEKYVHIVFTIRQEISDVTTRNMTFCNEFLMTSELFIGALAETERRLLVAIGAGPRFSRPIRRWLSDERRGGESSAPPSPLLPSNPGGSGGGGSATRKGGGSLVPPSPLLPFNPGGGSATRAQLSSY